jgi:ornithine cyclodeaminase/alanine dehydrogenase-like protein (mu-crystallin family)
MRNAGTLLLGRREVAELLDPDECIAAVEHAFRRYAEGSTAPPAILGVPSESGGFHIKAGLMEFDEGKFFVAKSNGNFPDNRTLGLPTIQGVIIVCDGNDGRLLALMDSIEITIVRTGAATAVAAKYLSDKDSRVMTVAGAGEQGRISLKMLSRVRPIEKASVYDLDESRSRSLVEEMSAQLPFEIVHTTELRTATLQSQIVVTCTPSKRPFLSNEDIAPGTFIAAVGSDNEEKHEVDPNLLAECTLVTDITEQCATIGELHHALTAGAVTRENVYAELGDIIAGRTPRPDPGSTIIFDSTGTGLQDVATAALVYRSAKTSNAQRFLF